MQFLVAVISFATVILLSAEAASAQNIYDGCGVDKQCLGYESANSAENDCLEAQVYL